TEICMPPRTKFDREAIIEAAFDIAKEEEFAAFPRAAWRNIFVFGCADLRE
ncbi:MAG: hypothetical protein QG610_973, partial [Euryarchaeota archaeon]|nr:hypothetical protein [Euryarchaeota archaeon]